MPRPNRIVELHLEDVVEAGLAARKTQRRIVADLNEQLRVRAGKKAKLAPINERCLGRYLARLRGDTAALVHTPANAEANAGFGRGLGRRIEARLDLLDVWVGDADAARIEFRNDKGEKVGEAIDHAARARILAEETKMLKLVADILERIFNAEQIRVFQAVVMDTIRDADAETARRIEAALREASSTRAAALLGVGA